MCVCFQRNGKLTAVGLFPRTFEDVLARIRFSFLYYSHIVFSNMYMYLPTGTRNARQRERSGDVTKRTVSFVVQWTEIEGKLLDKNGSRLTEFSNTWKLFVIGSEFVSRIPTLHK